MNIYGKPIIDIYEISLIIIQEQKRMNGERLCSDKQELGEIAIRQT